MAIIKTKYSIGDVVWYASTTTQAKQHPCPDCNDTKKWAAVSPAGNEYTFSCPRCSTQFNSHDELRLTYTAHAPTACKMTIGSVQFNSAKDSWDEGARYMCLETGVGSGIVYDEAKLFETENDALLYAQTLADTANATHPHIVAQYNRSLEISDYQLENGLLKKAADDKRRAGQLLWNLNDLFDNIKEADDKDAILEAIDDYRTYNWERDKLSMESAT